MGWAKSAQNKLGDSAVTMYWDDKDVVPGKPRRVGFTYGLGSVVGDQSGGQLGLTAGGELVAEKEFTLTAYVKNPHGRHDRHLTLPRGLHLAGGSGKVAVPTIPPESAGSFSPVTWKVKATAAGRPPGQGDTQHRGQSPVPRCHPGSECVQVTAGRPREGTMSFRLFVYYCAAWGAAAALFGWVLAV